jgi:UDP-N-acetylmuramate dehydrogenase
MNLSKLCLEVCKHGLSGLEFAYGIPGTVGGGVYMNAGAYGGELSNVIRRVGVVDENGNERVLAATELQLGYRHSVLMEHPWTVLWAELELTPDDPVEIRARMDDFLSRRREKQPLEYPSAGSTFKRPEGYFAGKLIQDAGLKGYRVGDAQVSEKHAGFVINRGNATSADVRRLISDVQRIVFEKFGVDLECEVRFFGNE